MDASPGRPWGSLIEPISVMGGHGNREWVDLCVCLHVFDQGNMDTHAHANVPSPETHAGMLLSSNKRKQETQLKCGNAVAESVTCIGICFGKERALRARPYLMDVFHRAVP